MDAGTVRAALLLLERSMGFVWATIVDSRGSSPRHAGASMLVREDGSTAGTIGGGPLEAAVVKTALQALQSRKTRLMDFDSAQLGMMCGGGGLVLIEYVDATTPGVHDLYAGLYDLLSTGGGGWLVTVASPAGEEALVRRCLVRSDGSVVGDAPVPLESLQELARRGGTYDGILAAGVPAKTYVQPVGARGKAMVFGAGHCGERIVPVLSMLGFFTTVVDDRADFANSERFPAADRIMVPQSFDDVVETLSVDDDTYLVIVTRGHQYDKSVLAQALKTPARYIGMMGSKKKVAEIFSALRQEGFSPADIARVHAPIGLPIGGETPEEIAISIAAELIEVRTGEARIEARTG